MSWEKFSFYFSVFILFSSCETLDPKIEVPSYIYVEPFEINNGSSKFGDDSIYSEKITDVWVYVDHSSLQGVYELPAIIPIDKSGKGSLSLRAGIKNAGSSVNRTLYPFYKEYKKEGHVFVAGLVDTLKPITFYDEGPALNPLKIVWSEDFDDEIGGFSFHYHPGSDTIVQKIEDPELSFRGDQCGGIFMNEEDFLFEMISPSIKHPESDVPVHLELNYKTDHEFIVGLYLDNKQNQIPLYVVKEKEDWNKIYFDFTSTLQSNFNAVDFNVFIGFKRNANHPTVEMYIDNIKLLHN